MKAVGGKRVVFTALIDNADVPMGCSFLIGHYAVQFPYLQRSWVSFIIEAQSKL